MKRKWSSKLQARPCPCIRVFKASRVEFCQNTPQWFLRSHYPQAKALKDLHEGHSDPVVAETAFSSRCTLQAIKGATQALGQMMSTFVVQQHHLWLNLAELKDPEKDCFLNFPISQGNLFGIIVIGLTKQLEVSWIGFPSKEAKPPGFHTASLVDATPPDALGPQSSPSGQGHCTTSHRFFRMQCLPTWWTLLHLAAGSTPWVPWILSL